MDKALSLFGPHTAQWFESCVGQPTRVQAEGWPAIARGETALIAAPTGTGKTLTAFLWFIDRLTGLAARGALEEKTYVLYISPLKALGNDIEANLRRPLAGIAARMAQSGLAPQEIRVAVRNGDTPPAERRALLRHPAHILITTPESLYLFLSTEAGRALLGGVEAVIVDELHALIDTKRGVHLMLSLERLNALAGRALPRIGLSATIAPLSVAAACLAGWQDGAPRPVTVVAPEIRKAADIRVEAAVEDFRSLPEGSVWPEIFRHVYESARRARTTLVFCEGRATCEKMAHGLNQLGGEGFARTHHGCVSREQRLEAERQLKSGELRVLCATSSMELGIDVGEIDLVVQIGAPSAISRALQRLGRAGHRPDEVSVMRLYPREMGEILPTAFIARGAIEKTIESVRPPRLCLDVLAQHLVSMAVETRYSVEDALRLARQAYSYRELSREQVENVLCMLAGDFERAADAPASPRLDYDRANGVVTGTPYSRMLALMSGGTIPDRGWFGVYLEDGTRLGELDEEFVFEARLGDRFLLGAFGWQIVNITRDRVLVRPCDAGGAQSPFWRGDGMGRPYETGLLFGRYWRELEDAARAHRLESALVPFALSPDGRANAARRVRDQLDALGALPTDRAILAEHFSSEDGGESLLFHSVFGRRVNLPLGLLLEEAATAETGALVRMHCDDDGILLHFTGGEAPRDGLLERLGAKDVRARVARLLPASALFSMAFRYNAYRALMMGVRRGGRLPLWVQRLRGAQTFARAAQSANHPLLWETLRECMEDYTDIAALESVLSGIARGGIAVRETHAERPSPMAAALRRQFEAAEMYDYTPQTGAQPGPILLPAAPGAAVDASALREASAPRSISSAQALHALLLNEGDLVPGDVDAPIEWLESLAAQGRALYIEPGLWICAEEAELYRAALEEGDPAARERLARRCLRYRGPLTADVLAERYGWPEELAQSLLSALETAGTAIACEGGYVHRDVYDRARRIVVRRQRAAVVTAPPERFVEMVLARNQSAGAAAERLSQAVRRLAGLALPLAHWEGAVLPGRSLGYRPDMLDALLARGEAVWRVLPGEPTLLRFLSPEAIDWNALPAGFDDPALSEEERAMLALLSRRGASFASALGPNALPALMRLAAKGLVRCDSFAPVRALLEGKEPEAPKQRARVRAKLSAAGRWEIARPAQEGELAARMETAFERWGILCRETARLEGIPWVEALARLRVQEYTGEVRRGYFVRALSGAQFVREAELPRVAAALESDGAIVRAVSACDPLLAWGLLVPPPEEAAFVRVPGNALVLVGGRVALIAERQGRRLRVIEENSLPETVPALARAYLAGQLFPRLNALCVKEAPACAVPALEQAGFRREMLDYVLRR